LEDGKREGRDGSWAIQEDGSLMLRPPAKKDFWRLTYYDPPFIKDDAPSLLAEILFKEFTVETSFTILPKSTFDQAGILLRVDSQNWVKTGLEVVDGIPRLSCVVTHGNSDWSTTVWESTTLRIRTSVVRDSVAVESFKNNEWNLVRIAPFSTNSIVRGGIFAACPEDQRGCEVIFRDFSVQKGTTFNHNADGNNDCI
jgi:regulation of enolase protein 1 (concanavalin A-like superfamily)